MNPPELPVTEEEIQRAVASMHTSGIWTLLLMADLAGGAVLFLIAWNAGWRGVASVVIAAAILGGLATLVGWTEAELRDARVFSKLPDADSPPPKRSDTKTARRMLVFVGLALVATAIFVLFPAAGRWLSLVPALASVVVYAWAVFGGLTRSRRRRHRR